MRNLSILYPRVLKHFKFWTDIQEQALAVSTRSEETTWKPPSMQNCLRALGFGWEHRAVNCNNHQAGNDTARTLAIFLHLTDGNAESPPLLIEQMNSGRKWRSSSTHQAYRHSDNVFQKQPFPPEVFPYLAKISLDGALTGFSPPGLLRHFAASEPVAVGLSKETHKRRHGWLSFSTLTSLRKFVNDVNGSLYRGKTWVVVEQVTPGFEKMTDDEWQEIQKSRQMQKECEEKAQIEAKRLERKKRRDIVLSIAEESGTTA